VQQYSIDGSAFNVHNVTWPIEMGDEDRYIIINGSTSDKDDFNRPKYGYGYYEAPTYLGNGAHGWTTNPVPSSNMTVKDANTVSIDLSKDYVDAIGGGEEIRFRIYNFGNQLYPNVSGTKVGVPGSVTENISNGSSDNYFSIDKPSYDYDHITVTAAYNTSTSSWSVSANAYIAKTITSVGKATFGSGADVDFSGVAGLTAEKAKVNTSTGKITYTTATTLKAGEGALLSGSADTYYIPVAASASADTEHNDLIGVTGADVTGLKCDASYNYYILTNRIQNGDSGAGADLGFYKVNSTSGNNVRVGSAYLRTATGGAYAPEFFPLFTDSETTGINAVKGSELMVNGSVYNLNGQRVAQPTKGLYIVNGRKVVIK